MTCGPRRGMRRARSTRCSGSITDREALERALHSCDAVAHLAAVADVNDVHASPEDAERVNARGTVAVLEAARRAGVKRIVYASTIWVYSDTESDHGRRGDAAPAPEPPLHVHQAGRRAVLQELPGALRDRLHDPALRDSLRTPGPRGGGHPGLRQQGVQGRAAHPVGRRHAVAPLRLRRGPRRRRRAGPQRRRHQPHLQPGQRRERHDPADRRARPGDRRQHRDRLHARPARRPGNEDRVRRARARGARLDGGDAVRRKACAATSTGAASRRPRRRWRRRTRSSRPASPTPRPSPARSSSSPPTSARATTCPPARSHASSRTRIPTRRSRSSTACRPWAPCSRACCARTRIHVPLGAVVVQPPVPAVHVLHADAVALAPAAHRVRAPRADAADPRPRSRPDRLDLSRGHGGAGRDAPQGPPRRALLLVDHRPGRPALLGPPGHRPPLRHPSGVDRGGRADRR